MIRAAGMRSAGRLERVLQSGRFAVTAEIAPADTSAAHAIEDRALVLAEVVDAINVTDASGANAHIASLAACAILRRSGYEPVLQLSCRDRNRIALQGLLLGAGALGIPNVLCLTGDSVTMGDQPRAKPVFDLDSLQLLQTARLMRDEGIFMSGREIKDPPALFLGAASNPFAPPFEYRAHRLAKKIQAGADFIQTQFCYDVPRFREFMKQVRAMNLQEKVYILAGVGPLRSARSAEWMRSNLPGVVIPEEIIQRLRVLPPSGQGKEGKRICVEIIQQVREIEGVAGVHLMAYQQENTVAEIIQHSGLLPRQADGLRRTQPRHDAVRLHESR